MGGVGEQHAAHHPGVVHPGRRIEIGTDPPAAVVGEHATVQGSKLTVTGSGNDLKVNDAGVVCGGIKTANATLYLIDTVLMPPAAPAETTSMETSSMETTATPTP